MHPREPERSPESLHCDHCGRTVRETQHTRSAYTVDYYSVRGGDGELCSFIGEERAARRQLRQAARIRAS